MEKKHVLNAFLNSTDAYSIEDFGSGLIHKTFVVCKGKKKTFILQEVNNTVFKWPEIIATNTHLLSGWLTEKQHPAIFPIPLKTKTKENFYVEENKYYRLIPFVEGSHSINVCIDPNQAYEAAKQFGNFTASFNGFDVLQLSPSIIDFHNLSYRWKQFRDALKNGNEERIKQNKRIIQQIENDFGIVAFYKKIIDSDSFKRRVTHHDTKISNVLFSEKNKGICVIDLDTVMSGYVISDLGDMFRTYLSAANEEEIDLELVEARKDFYTAIIEGYKENMADQMTQDEMRNINYAGEFMIYMQALRFFTDYLLNDMYYHINYSENNLQRTFNQLKLLKSFREIISQ